jgi:Putative bacterial sensory transduction regulator
VPISPIASAEDREKCAAAIEAWASSFEASTTEDAPRVLAVESDPQLHRWYVRMKGLEKEVVTIWMTIRQRTLLHETHFMPAPETNVCETYEYLLRRNAVMNGMRFCLGAENAVFLTGEVPVTAVTEAEIDRVVGASLEYTEAAFPAAMTIGYADTYRRRPRRR